ncbi:MAG: hypothetical protein AAGD06_20585 [Acidobacteriota bacterium]
MSPEAAIGKSKGDDDPTLRENSKWLLDYITSQKDYYRSKVDDLEKRMNRQRLALFWASTVFLVLYSLGAQQTEVRLLGVGLGRHDLVHILVFAPIIVAYQYASYSYLRLKHRGYRLVLRSFLLELNEITGFNYDALVNKHAYISSRGTVHRMNFRDPFLRLGNGVLRLVRWLPVYLVFLTGALLASAGSFPNELAFGGSRKLYIQGLALSVGVVVAARVAVIFSFRTSEKVTGGTLANGQRQLVLESDGQPCAKRTANRRLACDVSRRVSFVERLESY